MRILVAEDDQVTSKATCAILRGLGHQPIPAFDAVQALMTAMRDPRPDAIILDLNMPGGTGMGALDKLKSSSKTAEIPVVVVSGITDPKMKKAALDAGAAAYLYKPASPEQIQSALDAISRTR